MVEAVRPTGDATRVAASAGLFATAGAKLRPRMLVPRSRREPMPFPFDDPSARSFYLGRNAVFDVARRLGLGGQEVLVPAYFHGVELEALLAAGVQPAFYPVDHGMRVDPEAVAALVGPRTRAIYLTHFVGFPGPVVELAELCRDRGLLLIEDCALALLSRLGDRPLGTFGDAAVFCLYKTLPTPHGGLGVLRSAAPAPAAPTRRPSRASVASHAAASLLTTLEVRGGTIAARFAQTARPAVRRALKAIDREPVATGTQHFNPAHADLGMSRLAHVVLRSQDYPAIVERRRRNYALLADHLGAFAPPLLGDLPPGVCPLFYPVRTRHRTAAIARLRAAGVQSHDVWDVPHEAVPTGRFPAVDDLRETVLSLPCHQDLTPAAVERLASVARRALEPIA